MRPLGLLLLLATLGAPAACLLPAPRFAGLACDADHACADGFTCVADVCLDSAAPDGGVPGVDGGPGEGEGDGGEGDAGEGEGDAGEGEGDAGEGEGEGEGEVQRCFGPIPICAPASQVVTVCSDGSACAEGVTATTIPLAVATQDPVTVFVPAGSYSGGVSVGGGNVTIVGEGAGVTTSSSGGVALTADGSSTVGVFGMTLTSTGDADVVRVTGSAHLVLVGDIIGPAGRTGVNADSGTNVTLEACFVGGNTDGGALLKGQSKIENSVFQGNGFDSNGSHGSSFGGVRLESSAANVTFRFNTVVNNDAQSNDSGVICTQAARIENSISYFNAGGEIASTCIVHQCDVQGLAGADASQGNFDEDPQFEADGFHLSSTSTLFDRADDANPPVFDIDGDARPLGSGADIGADEAQ